jgi:hypothetical protein
MPTQESKTLLMETGEDGRYYLRPGSATEERITGLKELLERRLDGIDEATKLVRAELVRVPSDLDKAQSAAKALFDSELRVVDEKFKTVNKQLETIQVQFREKGVQVDENKKSSEKSVTDAFAAAEKVGQEQNKNFKEIVEKSEASNTKVIDQLQGLVKEVQKSLDDKVTELRGTVTRLDAAMTNMILNKTERRESGGYYVGIAGLVIAAASLLVAFFVRR